MIILFNCLMSSFFDYFVLQMHFSIWSSWPEPKMQKGGKHSPHVDSHYGSNKMPSILLMFHYSSYIV